jgi:hypothetical protein
MTLAHRTWHLRLWAVVAPLIALGLAAALAARPPATSGRPGSMAPAAGGLVETTTYRAAGKAS